MRAALGGLVLTAGWWLAAGPAWGGDEAPKGTALGARPPAANALRDLRGNRRPLDDFKGHKALVILFLGTECPVSNLYLPELVALEKKLRGRDVLFLAVYANEAEDLDRIAAHAYDRDVPFPVLKDIRQGLADALGVSRVPTAVVLDAEQRLRYRGRINDQYGAASKRPSPSRQDLAEAIEAVLGGKEVAVAETEADGCLIGRGERKAARTGVTFAKHVAPILQNRCQVCHRPDQAAPFSLLSYEDAVRHGRMIKEVTEQRRMPPWHADGRYGHWANDRRLTRDEIETLAAWVDGGMPEGDRKDLPKPVVWAQGWTKGKPDQIFEMPEEFEVPASGVVPYKNWILETGFTEDKWVRMAECRPGQPGVVHHIVAYIMKEGQRGPVAADGTISILVGWAPGDLGLECPPDTALRIPKGARLRLEMHYTPNGTAVKDRSAIGITFADKPPKYEMLLNEFVNMNIHLPPFDPHYTAEATFRLPADIRLLSFTPHMHWRGKHYRYEVIYPNGKKETLLSVPRWDFNWQSVYRFQEPLALPKGARLHAVAHWDNSKHNPLNPAPDSSVKFGLQSWEEMMVGFAAYVWERPEEAAEIIKKTKQSDLFFDRFDLNGDEVVSREEIPEQMRTMAPLIGFQIPEKMTRPEFEKFFDEIRKRFPQRRPDAPPTPDKEKKPGGG